VYKASTSTHSNHYVWLINYGASFHMTSHREWFCEYEKYNGGDVLLGDDSISRIVGCRRVKLLLKNGRIRTLPRVLHFPELDRNLISISKMSDIGVQSVFEKETYKTIREEIILMKGV
jgi:hypothetical protein